MSWYNKSKARETPLESKARNIPLVSKARNIPLVSKLNNDFEKRYAVFIQRKEFLLPYKLKNLRDKNAEIAFARVEKSFNFFKECIPALNDFFDKNKEDILVFLKTYVDNLIRYDAKALTPSEKYDKENAELIYIAEVSCLRTLLKSNVFPRKTGVGGMAHGFRRLFNPPRNRPIVKNLLD